MNSDSSSKPSTTFSSGYNLSEQTFALDFRVESCMDSENEDDSNDENEMLTNEASVSGGKHSSFLQPPGHEQWRNWDNIGDLHLAHTQALFYTVQEETETLQSIAAKFKITPTEIKRLNRFTDDFIFVGQKLRIRN